MAYIIKRLTDGDTTIDLGRRGENRATVIDFPLGFFIDNYGEGTPSLVHLRPGDTEPYVCYTVSTGDGYLRWYITDTDTAKAGSGKCELRWNVDDTGDGDTEDAYDTRAKSIIYTTTIHPSLTDETKIPDPYKDWYDAMMEGLTPVLEVESNPVFNLLDRGSEPRKSVIYAGDKLNQDKYVVPGAWWSPGWDTNHPIEDLPAVPAGSPFRFTVTGLYDSAYTSDPPRYLIRKIEAEVVYGGASTSKELNIWAQIVDTRHQTSADRMTFHEWYRIPTGGDLNILTAAVTDNTAGRLGMLAAGTNIDDLHENSNCGTYWLICLDTAVTGTLPASTGHGLLIINRQDSTYTRQTYIPVTNVDGAQSVVRWYSNSSKSWSAWSPTWMQASINELNNKVGFSIMGLTNLDAIPINGMGYVQTANDADFVPVSGVIAYNVVAFGYSNAQRTLVFSRTGNNTMYVNTKSSASAWSGWKSITMS